MLALSYNNKIMISFVKPKFNIIDIISDYENV